METPNLKVHQFAKWSGSPTYLRTKHIYNILASDHGQDSKQRAQEPLSSTLRVVPLYYW